MRKRRIVTEEYLWHWAGYDIHRGGERQMGHELIFDAFVKERDRVSQSPHGDDTREEGQGQNNPGP
jgi:hypothetical protein